MILGSAAIELLRQSETLAGRIAYIEVSPVMATEIQDSRQARDKLWLRGGFPDAYLAESDIAGAEIDLLIEHKDGRMWAIEIKRGLTAKPGKGFYHAIDDLKPERSYLVHSGDERYPIAENVNAIGLYELARELSS